MTDEEDKPKCFIDGEVYSSREEYEKKRKAEIIEKHFPKSDPYCDCGAKFDRDFPNIHSRWCRVYREIK